MEDIEAIVLELQDEGKSEAYIQAFRERYKAKDEPKEDLVETPVEESTSNLPSVIEELKSEGKSEAYISEFSKRYEENNPDPKQSEGESNSWLGFLKIGIDDGDTDIDVDESLANSWNNAVDHVSLLDDRFFYLSEFLFGDVESENFTEADAEINRVQGQSGGTLGFTDIDDEYAKDGILGAVGAFGAATFNAVTSFGSSAAINLSTFGAGLAVDMVSSSVKDYNDTKAEQLGLTVQQLVESGQHEIMIPTVLGSLAYSLEKAGLDKALGSFNKMPLGWKNTLYSVLSAAGVEGGTEFAQGLVESFNLGLAENNNDPTKALASVEDYLENDALETTLQGAVGGGLISAAGSLRGRRAARAARTKENTTLINASLDRINDLDKALANPTTEASEKEKIKTVREDIKTRLGEAIKAPYERLKDFDESELGHVAGLGGQLTDIQDKLDDAATIPGVAGVISASELQQQKEDKQDEIDNDIDEIIKEHERIEKEKEREAKKEGKTTPAQQKIDEIQAQEEADALAAPLSTEEKLVINKERSEKIEKDLKSPDLEIGTPEYQEKKVQYDKVQSEIGFQETKETLKEGGEVEGINNVQNDAISTYKDIDQTIQELDEDAVDDLNYMETISKETAEFAGTITYTVPDEVVQGDLVASKELEVTKTLIENNLNPYGKVDVKIAGNEAELRESYKGDSKDLPGGFYRKGNKFTDKVPLIFVSLNKTGNEALDTLIHEADHRLNDILRLQFPQIWGDMVEFVEKQKTFKAWVRINVQTEGGSYANLEGNQDAQVDEFMAQITGPAGQELIETLNGENPGFFEQIMFYLKQAANEIAKALDLKTKRDDVTELRDLVDMNLAVLLAGKKIEAAFAPFSAAKAAKDAIPVAELRTEIATLPEKNQTHIRQLMNLMTGAGATEKNALTAIIKMRPDLFEAELTTVAKTVRDPEAQRKYDIGSATKQVKYDEFTKKGVEKPPKGWSKEPKFKKLIEARYEANKAKQEKKESDKAAVEAGEEQTKAVYKDIKAYAKLIPAIEKWKEDNKTTWSQGFLKALGTVDPVDMAKAASRAINTIEPGETPLVSFIMALGRTALPKAPSISPTKGAPAVKLNPVDHKKAQASIGYIVAGIMMDKDGVNALDIEYDYVSKYNVMYIKDEDFADQMSDAVSELPDDPKNFRNVAIGKPHAVMTGMVDEATGRELVSRRNEEQQMPNNKEYKKVYEVIQKVDEQPYEVDEEQLGFIQTMYEKGLLIDKGKKYSKKQLRSKDRSIRSDLKGLQKVAGNTFYEPHQFVHNGRVQVMSTDVSHQSAKYVLSTFSFGNPEPQGKEGWRWLKVLAIDTFGFEGDLLEEREAAFDKHEAKWEEVAKDPMSDENLAYIMKADEPALFLRYLLEVQRAKAFPGGVEAYPSAIPMHMDATTSGIQILAGLAKDQESAAISNLTDTDQRSDSYIKVARKAWESIVKTTLTPKEQKSAFDKYTSVQKRLTDQREANFKIKDKVANAKAWEDYYTLKEELGDVSELKIDAAKYFWNQPQVRKKMRKIVKGPVMTKYYSATKRGVSDNLIKEWQGYTGFEGLDHAFTNYLAGELHDAADELMKAPANLMQMFQQLGALRVREDKSVSYHNPVSNFKAVNDPHGIEKFKPNMPYRGDNPNILKRNVEQEDGSRSIEISVAFDNDKRSLTEQKKQIAPFITHSFDAALVHWLILNTDYPIQLIHDSFATIPKYSEQLYKDVRRGYHEIMKETPLLDMVTEILDGDKELAKQYLDGVFVGDYDTSEALLNQFSFSAGVSNPALNDPDAGIIGGREEYTTAAELEDDQISESITSQADLTAEESKPC